MNGFPLAAGQNAQTWSPRAGTQFEDPTTASLTVVFAVLGTDQREIDVNRRDGLQQAGRAQRR